jgi:hypothetical protein
MCILAFFGNEVKMQYSAFLRFIMLLVICSFQEVHCTVNDIARWEKQAAEVTIIRDYYGIPHVYGKTDALVVFGMIYAQCEDDFNRVESNYISSMGRLNVFVQKLGDTTAVPITHETERSIYDAFRESDDRIMYIKDLGGDENFHVLSVKPDGSGLVDHTPFEKVRSEVVDILDNRP